MVDFRITKQADKDIDMILAHSLADFGNEAMLRYDALIIAAINAVAKQPTGISRKLRRDLGQDVYQYFLVSSRNQVPGYIGRVKHPRHYVIYRIEQDGNMVAIGRVLHDTSEARNYIGQETWMANQAGQTTD